MRISSQGYNRNRQMRLRRLDSIFPCTTYYQRAWIKEGLCCEKYNCCWYCYSQKAPSWTFSSDWNRHQIGFCLPTPNNHLLATWEIHYFCSFLSRLRNRMNSLCATTCTIKHKMCRSKLGGPQNARNIFSPKRSDRLLFFNFLCNVVKIVIFFSSSWR